MPAERLGRRLRGWQITCLHDLQRVVEHPFAHQVRVEAAGRGFTVVRGQPRGQQFRAVDIDAPAAARPKKKLHEALEKGDVRRRLGMRLRQDTRFEAKHRAVRLLHGDSKRHAGGGCVDEVVKRPHGQDRRSKGRVEDGRHTGRDERKAVVGIQWCEILAFREGDCARPNAQEPYKNSLAKKRLA